MNRTLEQYAKCDPFQVLSGSHAQALHFAKDAKADIAELAAENERLRRERGEMADWIKDCTTKISDVIGGGSEMFIRKGEAYRIDPWFVANYIEIRRGDLHEARVALVKLRKALETSRDVHAGLAEFILQRPDKASSGLTKEQASGMFADLQRARLAADAALEAKP